MKTNELSEKTIALATAHVRTHNKSNSAFVCLEDARNSDTPVDRARWAVKSLMYSVGICHPSYKLAVDALAELLK